MVLRRGQNRPDTLPVRLGPLGGLFLRFRLGGVRHGIGGEHPGLGLFPFVGLLDPRSP